jgi:hypothetical protein
MKCPKCQANNREGVRFCEECRAEIEVVCPGCNARIPPGKKFCGECGLALGATPPTQKSEKQAVQAERKRITVLFSDLSGYMALSERLDPEEVKEITNRIFGEVAQVVSRHEGFVEKYAGDAVLALFGVPKAHEDDHVRAIKAAREIHESVGGISEQYKEEIRKALTFHTGITTGLVVTGEVNLEKGTHGVAGDTYLQSKDTFSFEKLQPAASYSPKRWACVTISP